MHRSFCISHASDTTGFSCYYQLSPQSKLLNIYMVCSNILLLNHSVTPPSSCRVWRSGWPQCKAYNDTVVLACTIWRKEDKVLKDKTCEKTRGGGLVKTCNCEKKKCAVRTGWGVMGVHKTPETRRILGIRDKGTHFSIGRGSSTVNWKVIVAMVSAAVPI